MKKIKADGDELRAEYQREDFGNMTRGKYAQRCREATNVVVISPDIQKAFPNAQAVNDALRGLLDLAKASTTPRAVPRVSSKRAAG